jgi:pseudaminic acid cytidylyltransferase
MISNPNEFTSNNALAIIPARGGSKRIPRKNIRDFLGKPCIAWSIEAALSSELFSQVIVSTDDPDIAQIAKRHGAAVPFLRPDNLADDHTGTSAVVAHAIRLVSETGNCPEFVCCIYATAPFVTKDNLRRGFQILNSSGANFAFSVSPFDSPIQRGFSVTESKRIKMLYEQHMETRSQDLAPVYHDAGQFYWGRKAAWLDPGIRLFSEQSSPIILPSYQVQDIDTEEDWILAEIKMEVMMKLKALSPVP